MDRKRENVLLIGEVLCIICSYILIANLLGENTMPIIVQILISVIPTVGVIVVAIFNIRSGNKKIDEISRDASHIKPVSDQSLEYTKENNQYITRTFANQLNEIEERSRYIAKDIEARRLYSDPKDDIMLRDKLIGNIDKIYQQNRDLSNQLKEAMVKVEELQHELEAARAEIEILRNNTHEEDYTV